MTLTPNAAPLAADVLRRGGALVDGPLRAAVAGLAPALRVGAGFHLGFCDADGNPAPAAQGKMARPAFVLAAARAVGQGRSAEPGGLAVRAGVAVELVHNFSLVHDDVMDEDRVRRGRPTVWDRFGVPYAILLGDAMLALAGQVLVAGGPGTAGPPGPMCAPMCAELSSAVVALCVGQHQDMAFESRAAVAPPEYLEMVEGKTAALLAGSCVLGAMAGQGTPGQVEALRAFGRHVGIAFQLVDDVLGIFGDARVTGKPVGADLLRYKKTMPVLAAMASGTAAGRELARLYRTRTLTEGLLPRAVELVAEAGGRAWAEDEAARRHRRAVDQLDRAGGDADALTELRVLADLMIERNR